MLPLDDKAGSEQYVWTVVLRMPITIVIAGALLLCVLGANRWPGALSSPSKIHGWRFSDRDKLTSRLACSNSLQLSGHFLVASNQCLSC